MHIHAFKYDEYAYFVWFSYNTASTRDLTLSWCSVARMVTHIQPLNDIYVSIKNRISLRSLLLVLTSGLVLSRPSGKGPLLPCPRIGIRRDDLSLSFSVASVGDLLHIRTRHVERASTSQRRVVLGDAAGDKVANRAVLGRAIELVQRDRLVTHNEQIVELGDARERHIRIAVLHQVDDAAQRFALSLV